MKLGRNQRIATIGYGSVLLIGLALVVFDGLAAKDWLDSALLAVGSVIAIGGAVNVAQSLKSK